MWDEYDDQSAQLPPPKLNRAKAFLGMGLPDRSSSRFVDGQPPADATNVTNPGSASSYDGPGYSDDYAVKAGGAAGSTTRLANRKTHGGLDPSLGSDQSERDYLRAQYDRSESDWRDQHPDMTMTNGAGQSFTMAQSRPRMRADAAMSQLQMLREKIAADASREHVRAGDTIAGNRSAAEIAALNAKTRVDTDTTDAAIAKRKREEGEYVAGGPARQRKMEADAIEAARVAKLNEIKGGVELGNASYVASRTPQERDAGTFADGITDEELKLMEPRPRAAVMALRLKNHGAPADVVTSLTAPKPGEQYEGTNEKIANNPQLKGQYGRLQNIVNGASGTTAFGFANTTAIAGMRKAVAAAAQDIVRLGAAPDLATATDILVNKLLDDTQPKNGVHTRGSLAAAQALESLRDTAIHPRDIDDPSRPVMGQ